MKGTLDGVTTAYVGKVLEWTGNTSSMVKYYYAIGTRVAIRNGRTLYWPIEDHLSSTSVVANSISGLHSKMLYKARNQKGAV